MIIMFNNKWGVTAENFGAEVEIIKIFSSKEKAEAFKEELDKDGYYYHTALLTSKDIEIYKEWGYESLFSFQS